MTEIEISNGQNIIDIFFNDFASCLIIKKALAVNWPDCNGSIGEYYSISNYPIEERNFHTKALNKVLSEGTDIEQLENIKDFLSLFANGKYSVNKFIAKIEGLNFFSSQNVIYSKDVPENERFSGGFYPNYWEDFEPYLFSITNDKIDQNRVEHYCKIINEGKRPTILTFSVCNTLTSGYSCYYVLDGHHKIEAYLKLKVSIPVISILKLEECTNKTALLLNYAKTILKDFEYLHLFENNAENLLSIDFVNDLDLTSDLDQILKNSRRIDVSIINILKKYSTIGNDLETSWLKNRLSNLKRNRNTGIFGLGKGLRVYEKKKDEQYGECWFPKTLNTNNQLNDWIKKTLK